MSNSVDPARWEKVFELYHAALEREPELRTEFLANACEGDDGLRKEVESLLRQDLSEGDMLERIAADNRIWSPVANLKSDSHPLALSVGTRLGHYEILALLGAGGMGEVYRAKDTTLDREVAIKILPPTFLRDRERLARFEREAKVLASLNHPHIAQIYAREQNALIIEYVDGKPLKGPLPIETALQYSKQIADALGAAHEKRIVHRDLKPANVMITQAGEVKVLDFGLAAVTRDSDSTSSDPAGTSTLTMSVSHPGTILGTPSYMAPEQVRGEKVDKRADIWAFGCLWYEMLTGKPLFKGDSVSDILAAVIREEPVLEAVPPYLRPALEKCIRKDPSRRLRDIGDVQTTLEEAQEEEAPPRPAPPRTALPWALASMLAAALSISLWLLWPRPVDRPLMRLSLQLPLDAPSGFNASALAISPDSSRLAYLLKDSDGQVRLAVRRLDRAQATVLTGTEDVRWPFFSPDGQWIGFYAADKLKKISVEGGAPTIICDAPNFRGAAWAEDGSIVAALDTQGPLVRVSQTAGTITPLMELDKTTGEATQRWPQMLPGGKAVLFTSHTSTGNYEDATIVAQSLATGRRSVLWKGGSYGRYIPTGHLLFVHAGMLFAAPMDLGRLELTGQPSPVLESVAFSTIAGSGIFDFARNGVFVFQTGEPAQHESIYWIAKTATPQLVSTVSGAFSLRLSPDGRRVALSVREGSISEVWIYDLERATRTRITFGGDNSNPIWSQDGRNVVYVSHGAGVNEIQSVRSDGVGARARLYSSSSSIQLGAVSPDGTRLIFAVQAAGSGADLFTIPIAALPNGSLKGGPPEPFLITPFNEQDPEFSPDGRWIAHMSSETGRPEIYVRPFPGGPGGRWQISNGGGSMPVWSRNAHELFYIAAGRLMVASYQADRESFTAEKPRIWADNFANRDYYYRQYDLAFNGSRFIQLRPSIEAREKPASEAIFLLNFFDEVRRRAPPRK